MTISSLNVGIWWFKYWDFPVECSLGIWPNARWNAGSTCQPWTASPKFGRNFQPCSFPWRIHGAAILMVTWIPSIYPLDVSINIPALWILWVWLPTSKSSWSCNTCPVWFRHVEVLKYDLPLDECQDGYMVRYCESRIPAYLLRKVRWTNMNCTYSCGWNIMIQNWRSKRRMSKSGPRPY